MKEVSAGPRPKEFYSAISRMARRGLLLSALTATGVLVVILFVLPLRDQQHSALLSYLAGLLLAVSVATGAVCLVILIAYNIEHWHQKRAKKQRG